MSAKMKSDLIGKHVEVVAASNSSLKGLKGVVVDETKNMLLVEDNGVTKRVIKSEARFKISNDGTYEIEGKKLIGRPEEISRRIKK